MIEGTINRFAWKYSNASAPANPAGTQVTPGASNAEGSWTQIASSANIAQDVCGFRIIVSAGNTSGQAKNHLLDIGVDQAGGTSYTAVISNIICGQSSTNIEGGIVYYFPLGIKAGSSVAVRVQGSNGTAGTLRVAAVFYGQPSNPEAIRVGSFSETIGAITNSNGVSFTPGNSGAEGSWVSLGTTAKDLWWFQLCVQIDNGTTTSLIYHMDLAWGDGSNKNLIIENMRVMLPGTAERVAILGIPPGECFAQVPAGATLYVHGACSGTAETGWNAVAVGIGG
jgi:hypothetical protein